MRLWTVVGAIAATTATAFLGWVTIPAARAAAPMASVMTCTWGGTPAAPTGTFTISPGLTNTPSTEPAAFKVSGKLGGDRGCSGTFTYIGQVDAGGTCSVNSFQGSALGIAGVRRFVGFGVAVLGPARLYDKDGNVVGSENPQVATSENVPRFMDCGASRGFTGGTFSSVIELFASR
jgi:hypothetical protein